MVITTENTSTDAFTTYLEATTLGGVKGYKKIEVTETTDPCTYTITPRISSFAFDYETGTTINTIEEFKNRGFEITVQGGADICPSDKVYRWNEQPDSENVPADSEGALDSLNFDMTDAKGINTFYFAIGGDGVSSKSNVSKGNIVVCGLETLVVAEAVKNYLVRQDGSETETIEKSVYD